jgi:hypothetical protein
VLGPCRTDSLYRGHPAWPYTVSIMFGRTNPLNQRLTPRQKRTMAIVCAVVVAVFVGLGVWGSLASDSYSQSANGCINVTLPSTTGGGVLHYCGADAKNFCHSSNVQGQSVLATRARPQCVNAGLLPSAVPSP